MKIYWRTKTDEIKSYDRFKNPIYHTEENEGELVGGMKAFHGSSLIVALPNGKFDTVLIEDCYHKNITIEEPKQLRTYDVKKVDTNSILYTIEEWNILPLDHNNKGDGFWVKNGFRCNDRVNTTPQLDATHVIWFNK